MNTVTFLIIMVIFVIFIAISFFIEENSLKLAYWFIVGLAILTFINLYLSIAYYIKLRNEPGIPGPRGSKGERGPIGDIGKCTFSEKCGIENCDDKILGVAEELYPSLSRDCLMDITKCSSPQDKEKAKPVGEQIKTLIDKCKTTSMAEEDFMRRVLPILDNMEKTAL